MRKSSCGYFEIPQELFFIFNGRFSHRRRHFLCYSVEISISCRSISASMILFRVINDLEVHLSNFFEISIETNVCGST